MNLEADIELGLQKCTRVDEVDCLSTRQRGDRDVVSSGTSGTAITIITYLFYTTLLAFIFLLLLLINRPMAPYPVCERHNFAAPLAANGANLPADEAAATGSSHTNDEDLSLFEPEHATDMQWLGLRYLYIADEGSFSKYFVDGMEVRPGDDVILIHTAIKDKSFVWYGDTKELIELRSLILEHALRANNEVDNASTTRPKGGASTRQELDNPSAAARSLLHNHDFSTSEYYLSYSLSSFGEYHAGNYNSWSGYDFYQAREDYHKARDLGSAVYSQDDAYVRDGNGHLPALRVLYQIVKCSCSTSNFCARLRDISGAKSCE